MIALCAEHHAKADAGAFSGEQLRELKERGIACAHEVRGRFDWMRRDLLVVVGGSFYLETPVILELRGEPASWYNRDESGNLLLNFRMLTTSGEPRIRLEDNYWMGVGEPYDLESPPSGRFLKVSYPNGDRLQIEFFDLNSIEDLLKRYASAEGFVEELSFPMTAVEIRNRVGGTDVNFGPNATSLPGKNVIAGGFVKRCRVGLSLG
jgi:hypothetical protein